MELQRDPKYPNLEKEHSRRIYASQFQNLLQNNNIQDSVGLA